MAYSWSPIEALNLCGIKEDGTHREIKIICPFCNTKNFGFNTQKGIGQCWKCQAHADSASYYAATYNITPAEARAEIEKKLGIDTSLRGHRPERIVTIPQIKEEELAPADVRNKTYQAFLDMLPLTQKTMDNLLSRGLTENWIEAYQYKTFPPMNESERCRIAKNLLTEGFVLQGVPGFYVNKSGNWTFIQLTQGTVMPCRNHRGLITGLQIRKDDDCRIYNEETGEWEPKCSWFSSKGRNKGTGAHADVHYSCEFIPLKEKPTINRPVFTKGFYLTEGIMKADIVHAAYPNLPLLAVPGVHALKGLELEIKRVKAMGAEGIVIAYDMDYKTNPNVQAALEKTKKMIEENDLKLSIFNWETEVEVNGQKIYLKGIDDMTVFSKFGIIPKVV